MITMEDTPSDTRPPHFLERHVRTRVALIRYLAEGATHAMAAERFAASREGVRDFAHRHQADIEAMKNGLESEYTGLWVAEKRARVAEYQQDVEQSNRELELLAEGRLRGEDGEDGEGMVVSVSDELARLLRGKHRALRQAAEELGQLPSRIALTVGDDVRVRHILEGVDVDQL